MSGSNTESKLIKKKNNSEILLNRSLPKQKMWLRALGTKAPSQV